MKEHIKQTLVPFIYNQFFDSTGLTNKQTTEVTHFLNSMLQFVHSHHTQREVRLDMQQDPLFMNFQTRESIMDFLKRNLIAELYQVPHCSGGSVYREYTTYALHLRW